MFRELCRLFCALLFLFMSLPSFSQKKWPATLLWRISGEGLNNPSYLYGTMHLQDKRLFQFGDSLYYAMEHTEGLAVEIDFKEYFDSIMTNSFREAEKDFLLEGQKVKLDRKKLSKTGDSLLRAFGINGSTVNKKELKKIKEYRMNKLLQQGEMPTIVDGYLLGLALRQGKWTGGIEDVSDQLNLSDELGGELRPESVLQSDATFRRSMEQMMAMYLAQDLDGIENSINAGFSKADKDLILINRNLKMAYRMDSLSHQRSMLFAVGAAHLPGDSGVISLLRARGFTVEPVYSSKKLAGDVYAAALKEIEWVEVNGEEKAYTIQMPGKPSEQNLFGELLKMKTYFDITTMTFYMSGNVTGPNANAAGLDDMMKNTFKSMTGSTVGLKIKTLSDGNSYGKEAVMESDMGSYRIRLYSKDKTIFMLMAGSHKKMNVASADVTKFFASFVAGNTTPVKKEWSTLTSNDKAFLVRMPGNPSINTAIDKSMDDNKTWRFTSYNSIDPEKGFYYLAQVRELREGLYLEGDSAYFEMAKKDYEGVVDKVTRSAVGKYKGLPVLYLDGYVKKANANYKTVQVIRGNRVYSLLAGAPNGANMSDVDTFLTSLSFLDYQPVVWQPAGSEGFSTSAPSLFKKIPADSGSTKKFFSGHYRSYNDKDGVSYEVFKEVFSPTYWVASDTTYFDSRLAHYKNEDDSVLKKEWVQNGSVAGMDLLIKMPDHSSLKKVRLLVNADTLYTLFSMIPAYELTNGQGTKFFTEFRLSNEAAPTIYSSKATELLEALKTRDSLLFADASENVGMVTFEKKNLPDLYKSLLPTYIDSTEYYTVKQKLIDIIASFNDSSAVEFVAKEYPKLSGSGEKSKYDLLTLLAKLKTPASYRVLKNLLLTQPPAAGSSNQLQLALQDSFALTAALFPELLKQAGDSLFAESLVIITNRLLDSGLVAQTILRQYAAGLLGAARKDFTLIQKGAKETWEFAKWSTLLGWLNTAEGNSLLQQALLQKDLYLKQSVIIALLKNNLPVSALEINKVAADKSWRGPFYESLKGVGKQSLIPSIYTTQKSLAESELYSLFNDEYEDFTLSYVGERTEEYGGKKKLFHLFKVRLSYSDAKTKQNYLAVAGPYDAGTGERLVYSGASGYYTDEEFGLAKTAKLLKAYLAQLQATEK
ncbi:MAG TPA: TraB/GumN family protein [Flavisolibacter sp.]|nr:TraB/GumN family protein [Flavisolibacter sp.]